MITVEFKNEVFNDFMIHTARHAYVSDGEVDLHFHGFTKFSVQALICRVLLSLWCCNCADIGTPDDAIVKLYNRMNQDISLAVYVS